MVDYGCSTDVDRGEEMKLTSTEIKFMTLIWDNEPVSSGTLVQYCSEKFGWKKSTTYTFIKRLQERSILKNDDSIVKSCVKREEIQKNESEDIIKSTFNGSLPQFVTAFLSDKKLSSEEAEELKKLIDNFKEE